MPDLEEHKSGRHLNFTTLLILFEDLVKCNKGKTDNVTY